MLHAALHVFVCCILRLASCMQHGVCCMLRGLCCVLRACCVFITSCMPSRWSVYWRAWGMGLLHRMRIVARRIYLQLAYNFLIAIGSDTVASECESAVVLKRALPTVGCTVHCCLRPSVSTHTQARASVCLCGSTSTSVRRTTSRSRRSRRRSLRSRCAPPKSCAPQCHSRLIGALS